MPLSYFFVYAINYSIQHFRTLWGFNFMKKLIITFFFTILSCLFLLFLLLYSKECITLASQGLLIWYKNMIPSLFPFMILSGFIIRSGLSIKLGQCLQPILGFFFHLPASMLYVILWDFYAVFPWGLKSFPICWRKNKSQKKKGNICLLFAIISALYICLDM